MIEISEAPQSQSTQYDHATSTNSVAQQVTSKSTIAIKIEPIVNNPKNKKPLAQDVLPQTKVPDTSSDTLLSQDKGTIEQTSKTQTEEIKKDSLPRDITQTNTLEAAQISEAKQQNDDLEEFPPDNPKIQQWLKQAQKGNKRAQYELGFSYYNGTNGLTKDIAKGMEWYKRSVDNGYPDAQNALGYAYQLKRRYPEAIKLYRMVVQSSAANQRIKKEAQDHLNSLCKRFEDICHQ